MSSSPLLGYRMLFRRMIAVSERALHQQGEKLVKINFDQWYRYVDIN